MSTSVTWEQLVFKLGNQDYAGKHTTVVSKYIYVIFGAYITVISLILYMYFVTPPSLSLVPIQDGFLCMVLLV